jgi:SWI/SNF-related matrix-associated actin-dependent regulator of chromatin subfamily A3
VVPIVHPPNKLSLSPLLPNPPLPPPQALVFTQFNSTLDWLQSALPAAGFSYRTITGSMPEKQRTKAIEVGEVGGVEGGWRYIRTPPSSSRSFWTRPPPPLPPNHDPHPTPLTPQNINQGFQRDPPTTVFLLSVRSGAVGINLTAANHVFMLEPCLNPALEEQVGWLCLAAAVMGELAHRHICFACQR